MALNTLCGRYLRAGEPTVVSVLGNDVSPNGLVLAVQSVDTTATNASLASSGGVLRSIALLWRGRVPVLRQR